MLSRPAVFLSLSRKNAESYFKSGHEPYLPLLSNSLFTIHRTIRSYVIYLHRASLNKCKLRLTTASCDQPPILCLSSCKHVSETGHASALIICSDGTADVIHGTTETRIFLVDGSVFKTCQKTKSWTRSLCSMQPAGHYVNRALFFLLDPLNKSGIKRGRLILTVQV